MFRRKPHVVTASWGHLQRSGYRMERGDGYCLRQTSLPLAFPPFVLGPASPAIFSSLGSCLSLGLCTCFSHFLPCFSLQTPAFPSVERFLGAVCVDISRAFPRLFVSLLSWAAPGQGLRQPFGSRACPQGLAHVCRRGLIMNLGKCFMCFRLFSQS